LIDDFIELGIDILNPIQTYTVKMAELAKLKKRFGKNLNFCGGIDTHRILPAGTTIEVRDKVNRVIELSGGEEGISVHAIMNDVPAENVLAIVDAVEEFGEYSNKLK